MSKENVVDGVHNAPHRSLFHALGLTEEEQKRPLIGIVSSYNEIVPGHMNIDKITDAVKMGVSMAGVPSFVRQASNHYPCFYALQIDFTSCVF